jgi:hypothetical protein
MLEALSVLGVRWRWNDEGSQLLVVGSAGDFFCFCLLFFFFFFFFFCEKMCQGMLRSSPGASIFLDNAGTASRFLVAAALWLKEGDAVELRGRFSFLFSLPFFHRTISQVLVFMSVLFVLWWKRCSALEPGLSM